MINAYRNRKFLPHPSTPRMETVPQTCPSLQYTRRKLQAFSTLEIDFS